MKLYIMYSQDEYELPIAVAESAQELAEMTGRKKHSIQSAIAHGYKVFARITVEEDEDVNK